MSQKIKVDTGGVGFLGLLTLVFITLKLCGVITWSWWWVLAPMWMSFVLGFAIMFIVMLAAIIISVRNS